MVDELFSKRLPVTIKYQSDREDRKSRIQITVEMHTVTNPVTRKELVVRLTDEKDLFFLYTLKLTEEDFQSLKVQQGLLVDFGAFPQQFIGLLSVCLQEEMKDVPKFIIHLVTNGNSDCSTASLNVIETNPFKHLTHLSLKFLPGLDADVKEYLADCLKNLKDQNETLLQRLEHSESSLGQQLRQTREALTARSQELDSLKSEWTTRLSDLSCRHAQEMNSVREKAIKTQTEAQQRYERERRELEQAHAKLVKQLESKTCDYEVANKDLTDRKYKSESTVRELKAKLSNLEEEHQRARQELQVLRRDNARLDSGHHEHEKTINQMRTRIAVMEQEVKDKEELLEKTTAMCQSEQEHKHKTEEEVEKRKRHIVKLEASIKKMSEELLKGNEIIKKLQNDIRNYHAKLKLRSQVTTEQEKLLTEKNREMEEMRRDLEAGKTSLRQLEEENRRLNESLEATMRKLEESRQLLKTNENVISWLNKQITETQMSGQHRHGPFEMNSTVSSMGSARPALHNFSAPSYASSSRYAGSGRSQSPQLSGPAAPPPPRQHQVQYSVGQPRKSMMPVPLAKSSPIGTIPEEGLDPRASPDLQGMHGKQGAQGLQAKYLQQTPTESTVSSNTPSGSSPNYFSYGMPAAHGGGATSRTSAMASQANTALPPAATNTTRLSRDAIVPKTNVPKSSQPPLVSAYFPNQAKVT